jgi:hypothetical protein
MFAKTALLAVLVGSVAARHGLLYPGALAVERDLEARQTNAAACAEAEASIYQGLPTPPPAIVSYEATHTATDPCSVTVPASLSSDFSSYESAVASWFAAHSSQIESVMSQCPQFSTPATAGSGCSTSAAGGSGATAAAGTTTGGSASSASKNVGPRETGLTGAALAAAGLFGFVAAL